MGGHQVQRRFPDSDSSPRFVSSLQVCKICRQFAEPLGAVSRSLAAKALIASARPLAGDVVRRESSSEGSNHLPAAARA